MNQAKILMSVGAAAVSLVFSLQPHPMPFWETNIVIAADDTSPKGNVRADEDSSAVKSANVGKRRPDWRRQAARDGPCLR